MVSEGVTDQEIATQLGVSRGSITRWKRESAFQARVIDLQCKAREALEAEGIRNLSNRLASYDRIFQALEQIVAERAADPMMADVPGGSTGHLVPRGKHGYGLDTALIKALLDVTKQAAVETGDWEDRSRVAGDVLVREYALDPGEV